MLLLSSQDIFFVFFFLFSRGDDRFFAQNHVIAALRNFASTKNVHVTLVIHPRKVRELSLSIKGVSLIVLRRLLFVVGAKKGEDRGNQREVVR